MERAEVQLTFKTIFSADSGFPGILKSNFVYPIFHYSFHNTLCAEMHNNVGKFKYKFHQNHFILSLNMVNILQRIIDDEKSQMDLLKVQKYRK